MSENVLKGSLLGTNFKVAIVAGRFNEFITKELIAGAKDALTQLETPEQNITLTWVPGAYEIPLIAQELAATKRFDAIICLGAVIKGSTPHFDYVAGEVSKGIANASMKTGIPVIFGVLTTNTIEQAIERAGTKAGNKGRDAAYAAIEMASLLKKIHSL